MAQATMDDNRMIPRAETGPDTVSGTMSGTMYPWSWSWSWSAANPASVLCLIVEPGEEDLVRPMLDQALAAAAGDDELVVLRLGEVRLPSLEQLPGPPRVVRVIEAPVDDRGPLYQAITSLRLHYPSYDFLLLRPSAHLPRAWDARLRLAAYSGRNVGAVSPLSAQWADLAPPGENAPADDSDPALVDRWVYATGNRKNLEVRGLSSHCVLLRQESLAAVVHDVAGYHGSAADFPDYLAQRIYFHGYSSVVADHIWLDTSGAAVARASGSVRRLDGAGAAVPRPHALHALEQGVRSARQRGCMPPLIPGVDDKPVQLHVMHNWGGGLGRWVHDYCRGDKAHTNMALKPYGTLECFGEGLALYAHVDDPQPIRTWKLDPPIHSTAITHVQYQEILQEIIRTYGVSSMLISCFIGQSLDVLRTDVATVVVCHDYYPFCAAITIRFEGICQSCTRDRLASCFAHNDQNLFVRQAGAEYWTALRESFVLTMRSRSIPMVAPSENVVNNLTRLEPRLAGPHFHVVPHGIDTSRFPPADPAPGKNPPIPSCRVPATYTSAAVKHEKPRAVLLGRMTADKGALLLAEALPELTRLCDLVLLGCEEGGQRFAGERGVTTVPHYKLYDLPALLAEHQPDFGLLLSVWPETFSYTLSELMCMGIPPVATRLGAPGERIEDGVTGFFIEPNSADLLRRMHELVARPEQLAAVRRNLAQVKHRTLEEMTAGYAPLLPLPAFSAQRYIRGSTSMKTDLALAAGTMYPWSAATLQPSTDWILDQFVHRETFGGLVDRVYEVAQAKVSRTPRLSAWQRPMVRTVLSGGYNILKFGKRIFRRAGYAPRDGVPVHLWPQGSEHHVSTPPNLDRITDPGFREHFVTVPDIVASWVQEHLRLDTAEILDFGCGYGVSALGMKMRYGVRRLVGLDIMPDPRQCLPMASAQLGLDRLPDDFDLRIIPVGEPGDFHEEFDLAYSWSVFEHVEQGVLDLTVRQIFRSLKPRGLVFVQIAPLFYSAQGSHLSHLIPQPWAHLLYQHNVFWDLLVKATPNLPAAERDALWSTYRTLNRITAPELVELFQRNGFEVLRRYETQESIPPPQRLLNIFRPEILSTNQVVLLARKNS